MAYFGFDTGGWGIDMARLLCCLALLTTLVTAGAQEGKSGFVLVSEGAPIREVPFIPFWFI